VLVCHVGLTTGGTIGGDTAWTLDECIEQISRWTAAAREIRPDILVLCHGGRISSPQDAAYVLSRATGIEGFYGASSMERLPVEVAIAETVRGFRTAIGSRDRSGRP
jgi:predicted TIM-barrel enzyme